MKLMVMTSVSNRVTNFLFTRSTKFLPGHPNTRASILFKSRAILAHQKYWRAKQIKHLNFCSKIIVISKKRCSLEISLGFRYFSLKISNVGKNKRKWSFYIKSVFDFWRNFCKMDRIEPQKIAPKKSKELSVNSGTVPAILGRLATLVSNERFCSKSS